MTDLSKAEKEALSVMYSSQLRTHAVQLQHAQNDEAAQQAIASLVAAAGRLKELGLVYNPLKPVTR